MFPCYPRQPPASPVQSYKPPPAPALRGPGRPAALRGPPPGRASGGRSLGVAPWSRVEPECTRPDAARPPPPALQLPPATRLRSSPVGSAPPLNSGRSFDGTASKRAASASEGWVSVKRPAHQLAASMAARKRSSASWAPDVRTGGKYSTKTGTRSPEVRARAAWTGCRCGRPAAARRAYRACPTRDEAGRSGGAEDAPEGPRRNPPAARAAETALPKGTGDLGLLRHPGE